MGFHHVAIATRDLEASHRFYTEATGFQLVRVEAVPMEKVPGWAKHLFYDTGNGEMLAIWDIHDDTIDEYDTAISTGLGLPIFINHIAFAATDLDDLDAKKNRWLENGHDVMRIDHGWCTSVYTVDPAGVMVEFSTSTRAFDSNDYEDALRLLTATEPELLKAPEPEFFKAG